MGNNLYLMVLDREENKMLPRFFELLTCKRRCYREENRMSPSHEIHNMKDANVNNSTEIWLEQHVPNMENVNVSDSAEIRQR